MLHEISGLAWFSGATSLLLGLLLIALAWPFFFPKAAPRKNAPRHPKTGEAAHEKPSPHEKPPPEAPPVVPQAVQPETKSEVRELGPTLCTDHQLWLLRILAVQRFPSQCGFKDSAELEKIKLRIWRFVDDRPNIIATGCHDGQARLYRLKTGKPLISIRHDATNRDAVHSVSLTQSAAGPRLLTGAWDGRWHEWKSWPSQPARPSEFLRGEPGVSHENQVTSLAVSRDGNYLACSCTAGKIVVYRRNCPIRQIELHDLEDVMELKDSLKLGDHGEFVVQRRLELSGGKMLVEPQEQLLPEASVEGFKRRSALDDVEVPATFRFRFVGCLTHGLRRAWRNLSHDGAVLCMVMDVEGSSEVLYSGSRDRHVRKWSLYDGNLLLKYSGHTSMVRCLAVNSMYLASGGDDRTVRLWNKHAFGEGDGCLRIIPAHKDFVRAVALCNTFLERLVSAGEDRSIILWNAPTGEKLREFDQASVATAILLAGSCMVTAGEDARLRIWNTELATVQHTVKHPQRVSSLSWLRAISV